MKKNRLWSPNKHRLISTLITACVACMFALIYHHLQNNSANHTTTPAINYSLSLPQHTPHPSEAQKIINALMHKLRHNAHNTSKAWQQYTVTNGDSLNSILKNHQLSSAQIYRISRLTGVPQLQRQLRPKQIIYTQQDSSGQLTALRYQLTPTQSLLVQRKLPGPVYSSSIITIKTQNNTGFIAGKVTRSLAASMQKAGANARQIKQFETIFAWKINFKRDLRHGDKFAFLYQQKIAQQKILSRGAITMAQLQTRRKTYFAIRFQNKNQAAQYYTLQGKNWQGRFLRAPLKYKRISSTFSLRRWHPVLKIWRPHYGVDFAAPTGTPIKAAADGTITHIKRSRSYGNIIYIQHNAVYSTRYAHMQKFAKGLHKNSHVKQGQVIGYVGTTGYSTGPHLHYELRVYGIPKNPLTVKLPAADPVSRRSLTAFKKTRKEQLDILQNYLNKIIAETNNKQQAATYNSLLKTIKKINS